VGPSTKILAQNQAQVTTGALLEALTGAGPLRTVDLGSFFGFFAVGFFASAAAARGLAVGADVFLAATPGEGLPAACFAAAGA